MMGRSSLFDSYLDAFQRYFYKYRKIPSMSECTSILGISSKSTVHNFFQQLIENGYLVKKGGTYFPGNRLTAIPFFESVWAGSPTAVADGTKQEVSLEQFLVENPETTVLVKIKGDSMIDAGMMEGDIAIVDREKKARIGDVVIAIVDGEYTIKFLEKDHNGKLFLNPANPNYDPIYPTEKLEIFGVVTGTCRKY